MSILNLLVITIVGLVLTVAESMRFDLKSGHTKCISEDIKSNAMTVGKYSVVNPNEGYPLPDSHKLTVRVINNLLNFQFRFVYIYSIVDLFIIWDCIIFLVIDLFLFFVCMCKFLYGFVLYMDLNDHLRKEDD